MGQVGIGKMDANDLEHVMANQYSYSTSLNHYCDKRLPKKPGIYRIGLPNDRFYIGKSVNMFQRQMSHLHALRNNKHTNQILQRIYDKHTHYSFTWSALLVCDKLDLEQNEQMVINLYWYDPGMINIKSESQSIPNKPREWTKRFVFMNCWTRQPVWFSSKQEAQKTFGWSHDKTRHRNYKNHQIEYVFEDSLEKAVDYAKKRQSTYISNGVVWNKTWYPTVKAARIAENVKWTEGYFRRLIVDYNLSCDEDYYRWRRNQKLKKGVAFNGKVYTSYEHAYNENDVRFLSLDHFRKYVKKYGCQTISHLKYCSTDRNSCPIGDEHLYSEWQNTKSDYRPNCYLVAHVNGRWYSNLNEAKQAIYNTYKNED